MAVQDKYEDAFWQWYWSKEPDTRGTRAGKRMPARLALEEARAILYVAGYLTSAENERVRTRLVRRARKLYKPKTAKGSST